MKRPISRKGRKADKEKRVKKIDGKLKFRVLDRVLQEVREDFALMLALPDPSMALLTPECYYNEVLRRFYKLKNE